jgi:hypothetical protein
MQSTQHKEQIRNVDNFDVFYKRQKSLILLIMRTMNIHESHYAPFFVTFDSARREHIKK